MVFGQTVCGGCRVSFRYPLHFGEVRYCSATCRVAVEPPQSPWEYKGCRSKSYFSKSRKAAYSAGDRIDPLVVYRAFNWTCSLCGARIDPLVKHPDPMCASIDHVVPLSAGGGHVWENVTCAHKRCNEEKDRF